MTSAGQTRERMCSQHHQPLSQCEPWDRHTHSNRFRGDTWGDVEAAATEARSDATTFITEATEAALGYVRCYRCALDADPIPLEFGDLTGKPLREWIAGAVKLAVSQHPRHEPVMVGADPGTASAPAAAKGVVFREPQPAQ